MKDFAELYRQLDRTTKTNAKVAAMVDYFKKTTADDAAWAIYFLTGNKLSRALSAKEIRQWAIQEAAIPSWLFEECYTIVGDLAETLALLVTRNVKSAEYSLTDQVETICSLAAMDATDRIARLSQRWAALTPDERLLFAKLITGSLRIGVSRGLVTRSLAEALGLPQDVMAHRLMGKFSPTAAAYQQLVAPSNDSDNLSRPYPFCLANPLSCPPHELLTLEGTLAEWKWDGIRAQVIRRRGETFVWSRGEERIEDRFPELRAAAEELPDGVVLDGELLGWKDDRPLPFLALQRRINRKTVGKKLLNEVPIVFQAFDLLEESAEDRRSEPLSTRRQRLERLLNQRDLVPHRPALIRLSPQVLAPDWPTLTTLQQTARRVGAEGLMLKSLNSTYASGRTMGHWWKWKVEPFTIDAVLIYAQRGHGRRATLYTDYTFALWHDGELIPFAKAYSGLTDTEIQQVDRFVRQHTIERFGPVRRVEPQLVMELAFESIQRSQRHKSGIAVRFPRIARWRRDKAANQANTLGELQAMADKIADPPPSA